MGHGSNGSDGRYDVIVVGVGGVGSAAVYRLADRGLDVLGLERYDVPHTMGSSHGSTRIIRRVQHENPSYVPLVERAYDRWRELEATTGRDLLTVTGSVHAGQAGSDLVESAVQSCNEGDIPFDRLDGAQINDRFPGYELPADFEAVYQPDGGFLACEDCIVAHVEAAHAAGATVRAREPVLDWSETAEGVRVRTGSGRYVADELVLTAGPWTAELVPGLADQAVPVRAVMAWFQPEKPDRFSPARFPVFVLKGPDAVGYGFPIHDVPGFKLGRMPDEPQRVDPGAMERTATTEEEARHRRFAERYFPHGAGPTLAIRPCIQTYSVDEHFVIGRIPGHDAVTVGAGFSGHGFKFASVLGELLADLVITGRATFDRSLHGVERF